MMDIARALATPWVLCVLTVVGCTPALTDGRYACGASTECPSGWTCVGGRCHRPGSDCGECRIDAHCDDSNPCTLDVCESGCCSHDPDDTGLCDDGSFCNGPDACHGGSCVNQGPSPCMDACNEATGCASCGGMTQPCCPGGLCSGDLACISGTCSVCGTLAGPCCFGGGCMQPMTACGGGNTCEHCGGDGDLCCMGGSCAPPLECGTDGHCTVSASCVGISCPTGTVCKSGSCVACGQPSQPCCTDTPCVGSVCLPTNECGMPPCGDAGQPCCSATAGAECTPGLICDDVQHCQPCGGDNQPCCTGDVCMEVGTECVLEPRHTCHSSCGLPGFPCCGGSAACVAGHHCMTTCVPN